MDAKSASIIQHLGAKVANYEIQIASLLFEMDELKRKEVVEDGSTPEPETTITE